MDVDQYRKAYAAELEKAQAASTSRFEAMRGVAPSPSAAAASAGSVAATISILGDATQLPTARIAALKNVQAVTFLGPQFDPYRASFRQALRTAATDRNADLRERALEVLALDKDEVARDLLLKGLENADQALVSPAKAIKLLAHDDHGVALPMARKILNESKDVEAKEQALRVLAADPSSHDLFAKLLADQSQPASLRSISAAGLRATNPKRFAQEARRIVMDATEDGAVRADALSGLAHARGLGAEADQSFADEVSKLSTSGSAELRSAASRFLKRESSE